MLMADVWRSAICVEMSEVGRDSAWCCAVATFDDLKVGLPANTVPRPTETVPL